MIRLVSQFDAPRARAQVASPKSSACSCCCCCCVASVLTSSILTARAIGRVPPADERPVAPPDPTPPSPPATTPVEGAPATAQPIPTPAATGRSPLVGWKVFGFFLFGLCVGLATAVATGMRGQAGVAAFVLTFIGSYLGGLLALRRWVGLHGGWIIGLVIGLPIAVVLEALVWISAFLKK